MDATALLFYVFSALAVGSALLVVTGRNALACAVFLVVCFFNLAALYVLLDAHFLAVAQILIYAGAITVLILFVIMLLDITHLGAPEGASNSAARGLGVLLVALFFVFLGQRLMGEGQALPEQVPEGFGTVARVGELLMTRHLLAFELTALLLLAAIVAAVAIAHKPEEDRP